jgi:hypothetical protein
MGECFMLLYTFLLYIQRASGSKLSINNHLSESTLLRWGTQTIQMQASKMSNFVNIIGNFVYIFFQAMYNM